MLSFQVLVLNASYEPLHFCSARRAIVLLMKGKAVDVECDGNFFRSPSRTIRLPVVIKLSRYIVLPAKREVAFSKRNIFKRDNYSCQYCGASSPELTLDHIVPRSRGGLTTWENVVVACQSCNLKKGNRPLAETSLKLLRKPKKPSYFLYQLFTHPIADSRIEVWQKYLPGKFRLFQKATFRTDTAPR